MMDDLDVPAGICSGNAPKALRTASWNENENVQMLALGSTLAETQSRDPRHKTTRARRFQIRESCFWSRGASDSLHVADSGR